MITGAVVAYLLGSIVNSVWIGKAFYGIDVRTVGSKNAGATNTIRTLGTKPGMAVLILDAFKGWLAVFLGNFFGCAFSDDALVYYKLILGVFAIFGHVFPIFAGFKGGKGVATILGVLIALYWNVFPVVFGLFILVLWIWRYLSLASIITAICFPVIYWVCTRTFGDSFHPALFGFTCSVAAFIPFTHRKNIRRLRKGEESKFKFKKTSEVIIKEFEETEDFEENEED